MERLEITYYAGLLTAARYHGAAHHQPQRFQVLVPKNRSPIRCGGVAIAFVARHNAAAMPTVQINTPRGHLAVSSPEATAYDLAGHPEHCGGLDNVATVLAELGDQLDPDGLRSLAPLSPLPWAQRLGFLLDRVGHDERTGPLASLVSAEVTDTPTLSPGERTRGAQREPRWKLLVNTAVEPDL